ncbi:MAG: TraB/GumN family protein [Saprospiraceae bacterium]|nr:TraB/GumN family protein [Candidatus Vicinibacter affinis]
MKWQRSNLFGKKLETVAFQLSVFDSIPYKAQAQMLVESLKSNDGESSGLKEMIKSYIAQDLNKLSESIAAEETAMNPYLDMMLNNRNKKWIPIMAEVMKKEPCFFEVRCRSFRWQRRSHQLCLEK